MSFISRVFRGKDASSTKKHTKPANANPIPAKPKWTDAWLRTEVAPEEVQDLIRGCAQELKGRALDAPFLLLPFRPSSDPSAARTFIRNYFNQSFDKGSPVNGDFLMQELRLNEPMVLCSVMKWCWSRLPGGVVTWEAYELFKVGESDSDLARDAFSTFIPISVDSDARSKIIFDFFDLLAAIAAHGKSNGLGGRKLSRYAGWWAFEHHDTGNGFEASYRNWEAAADATSHLFFAYLRSLSPDVPRGVTGISSLPLSLQTLVEGTEYPPETPTLLQVTTTKVVMIVDTVSPTPFALLRRAKNFEYRDEHWHLQEFAEYEDPIQALTDECQRVLKCISSANESSVSTTKHSVGLKDASWSRFEDIGFSASIESDGEDDKINSNTSLKATSAGGLSSVPLSRNGHLGRPTTPSWADFMSSGFSDERNPKYSSPMLLPPDKVLPPIVSYQRGQSSQSHKRNMIDSETALEPAELASINTLDLDDSFWWVWITSLSADEPAARKAVFGRCTLVETVIRQTKWLVLEEQIKGAAPEPEAGAHIVEKKHFFSFGSRKAKINRSKSTARKASSIGETYQRSDNPGPQSKVSIGADQHKRIQQAAAALQQKHREQEAEANQSNANLDDETFSTKTNSVMTLQPGIVNEASSAMKWARNYDKDAIRAAYLDNSQLGTRGITESMNNDSTVTATAAQGPSSPVAQPQSPSSSKTGPPPILKDASAAPLPPSPSPVNEQAEETKENAKTAKTVVIETPPLLEPHPSEDSQKKLKKKNGNAGFKSMFSSTKKKGGDQPPMKSTGAGETSVAAARAALEAKANAAQGPGAPKPVLRKNVPISATPVATGATSPSPEKPSTPKDEVIPAAVPRMRVQRVGNGSPPQTRHAIDSDALSRVDTDERAAADHEFSKFDQGPLDDQPAFVPEDDDLTPVPEDESPQPSRSNGHTATQGRWAQIRKNAAERAADESAPRLSQSERTDDGETSGEETIESRVARIKARVAELTGDMEAAR
ncbi:hypothetical protein N7495_009424 [Penicillium taxi]|uniref:uncharacterized protein n=1 Tax=Penicillium taxi TaxID=168475 RepID=UPI0025451B6F|nr:uncharacterized protein N7495_009424 [Penicillium taxi]KAJ5884914.1 hypothetical protein N7495_009424 [Penicillium taxi]